MQHLLADRTPYETPKVDEKVGDKWVDKHFDMFSFDGFKWPPVFTREVKSAVQHLPPRQQEFVSFFLSVLAKEKRRTRCLASGLSTCSLTSTTVHG